MLGFSRKLSSHQILAPDRIRKYVAEIIAPHFSLPGDCVFRLEEIKVGSNTKLYTLPASDSEKLILRFHPVKGKKRKGTEHAFLSNLLRNNGVPVPKILFSDLGNSTLDAYHFEVVVEEYINGAHATPDDLNSPEVIDQIATMTALIHAEKADLLGKPWREETFEGGAGKFFNAKIGTFLNAINKHLVPLKDAQIRHWMTYFECHYDSLESISSYGLIHNDLSSENILVDSGKRVYLIDFGAMSYFFFEYDLVLAFIGLCQSNPEIFAKLTEAYFSKTDDGKRKRFEQNQDFFLAYHHLAKAASNAKKSHRQKRKPTEKLQIFKQRAEKNWQNFLNVVERS